jgi:hypothetical protein
MSKAISGTPRADAMPRMALRLSGLQDFVSSCVRFIYPQPAVPIPQLAVGFAKSSTRHGCADQQSGADHVPLLRQQTLATIAAATRPKRRHDLGKDHAVGQRLASQATYPSSLAASGLRCQTPRVGAVCPNWARTDNCGGRSAMNVPTAIRNSPR